MAQSSYQNNQAVFRGCFAAPILELYHGAKGGPRVPERANLASMLRSKFYSKSEAESTWLTLASSDKLCLEVSLDSLSQQIFASLPQELRTLSCNPQRPRVHIDVHILSRVAGSHESALKLNSIVSPDSDGRRFLDPIIHSYVKAATSHRTERCELCEPKTVSVTRHYFIPKGTPKLALQQGWHGRHDPDKVANICRLCHDFVHRFASRRVLAERYHSLGLLTNNERILHWTTMLGRVGRMIR